MTEQASVTPKRDWMDLTVEELTTIVTTGNVPDLTWNQLATHPRFREIFQQRNKPTKVAAILLEAKGITPPEVVRHKGTSVTYKSTLSPEYRAERNLLKSRELDIQAAKVKNQTVLFDKVCQLETDMINVKKYLKSILELTRETHHDLSRALGRKAAAKELSTTPKAKGE